MNLENYVELASTSMLSGGLPRLREIIGSETVYSHARAWIDAF